MPIYQLQNAFPQFGEGCFIAPNATVIGKVFCGDQVNIWFGTVVRGDVAAIHIGSSTNVQDLVMLHVSDEIPLIIGKEVSIGHKATLHSCQVGDNCLIGMDSIILDNVKIGENCLVAAGSVLPPGKNYPAGSLIKGSPAQVIRPLNPNELKQYGQHFQSYIKAKNLYLKDSAFNQNR
jgi:carbonic anhydrase/acetyltransferase-like protein (isoleucine patch superfamily)